MGGKKHNHYVPKCYLRNFSSDGTRIFTYRVNSGQEPRLLGINDVCVEKNFYTLHKEYQELGFKKDLIETDFFCNIIEPKLSETISLIKGLKDVAYKHSEPIGFDLGEKNRISLLYLLLVQYFRGPKYKGVSENGTPVDALEHAYNTYANKELMTSLVHKLNNDYWIIRVNPLNNFLTSDEPVVVIDNQKKQRGEYFTKAQIGEKHTAVFFPLSYDITLEIYDKEEFPEAKLVNNTVQTTNVEYEKALNGYQYLNAERFVFSYTKDFSLFIREI